MLKSDLWNVGLTLGATGLLLNGISLFHIVKSFNIKTHVFTLIFIDAAISTAGCCLTTLIYILANLNIFARTDFVFCHLSFLSHYLPILFGALLTFLVAAVRYFLAKCQYHKPFLSASKKLDHFTN